MINLISRCRWMGYGLSLAVFLCGSLSCLAQYENVWAFGGFAGIDFGTDPPQPFKTGMTQLEGSAAISNHAGKLLFYTNGHNVWNRDHVVMPNGADLDNAGIGSTTFSTSQASVIIPYPGTAHRYFLFSLSDGVGNGSGTDTWGKLTYCIVDMSLDEGRGDVRPEYRNTLVDTGLTENLAAVAGDRCDAWLITVTRYDSSFKAYHITAEGINPVPMVSKSYHALDYRYSTAVGYIDLSSDRKRLAIAQDNIALYDFDVLAGTLSNPLILPFSDTGSFYGAGYGIAFSPDQTKLYVAKPDPSSISGSGLWQLDITSRDPEIILNGKVKIADERIYGLKRAPDGKIYGARSSNATLDVIAAPNLPGPQCRFTAGGFPLAPGTGSLVGLPTMPVMPGKMELLSSKMKDTFYCTDALLLGPSRAGGYNFKWEDGSRGDSRRVDRSGLYTLYYQVPVPQGCREYIDTFDLTFIDKRKAYNRYVIEKYCRYDTAFLTPAYSGASQYQWHDGFMGMERSVHEEGVYWVRYYSDSLCQEYVDSFVVSYDLRDYQVSFEVDTLACQLQLLTFHNRSDQNFNRFQWFMGDGKRYTETSPGHRYAAPGKYEVMLTGITQDNCRDTALVTIEVDSLLPVIFHALPDAVCVGATVNFWHELQSPTIEQLQWRFGDGSNLSALDRKISHAYDIPGRLPVVLTARFRACPEQISLKMIDIEDLPEIDLGIGEKLCPDAAPLVLYNRHNLPLTSYRYLWSTGDTTESITARHPGLYALSVTHVASGCVNSEQAEVKKDCFASFPNVFSPNGDGHNDFFFPRQYLTKSVTQFQVQLFNRWGQLVFESRDLDGRGWDGTYNGKPQPAGVYVYRIKVSFREERQEQYSGNVTLIR